MAVGSPEQIEEERRLLYVAMTRARQHLHLIQPLRFFPPTSVDTPMVMFSRCAAASFQTAFSTSSRAEPEEKI
jgi:ATP-dependent exoDNAse (exonuclease V) beta subunit